MQTKNNTEPREITVARKRNNFQKSSETLFELAWVLYRSRKRKESVNELLSIRRNLVELPLEFFECKNYLDRADALHKLSIIFEWMSRVLAADDINFAKKAVWAACWGINILYENNKRNSTWCSLHLTLARVDIGYKNSIVALGHFAHAEKWARRIPNPNYRVLLYKEIAEVRSLNADTFTSFRWAIRAFFVRIAILFRAVEVPLFGD